ncbi:MAG: trypsin-like serine protease [Oscillospiraceae bacterium]|jgi:V8-like Glu-specific endopeptidase|nr:trypsin-like serine protease [Oscillospiraceae bacterium]
MLKTLRKSKLLVKTTGVLTALAMATCLTAYFDSGYEVSAYTQIRRGDVDRNDVVGISDLVLENKYLIGQANIDPDRADINHDGVVDITDSNYLANRLVGNTVSPTWTTFYAVTSMTSNNAGIERYVNYDVEEGTTSDPYPLTVDNPQPPNGIMPLDFNNGEDDRDPYTGSHANAIIEVGTLVGNVFTYRGSGFIIGNNKVVTAAHCVYNHNEQEWKDVNTIRIQTGEIYYIKNVHIPKDVYEGNLTSIYDYALLKINTIVNENTVDEHTVDLSEEYGYFDVGIVTNDRITYNNTSFSNSQIRINNIGIIGYPQSTIWLGNEIIVNPLTSNKTDAGSLYVGWGSLFIPEDLQDEELSFYTYGSSGQSGGPIIYDKDNNHNNENDWLVVGTYNTIILNQDFTPLYSKSCRFNAKHLKFFFNNPEF